MTDPTTGTTPINLDWLAAKHAQTMIAGLAQSRDAVSAKGLDTSVTKAIGVLQENGVYASVLFLLTRSKKELAYSKLIVEHMLNMLTEVNANWSFSRDFRNPNTLLGEINNQIISDLAQAIWVKELLELMLTYARYSAKAAAKG